MNQVIYTKMKGTIKEKIARKQTQKAVDKGMSFIIGKERQRYRGRSTKSVKDIREARKERRKEVKEHGRK